LCGSRLEREIGARLPVPSARYRPQPAVGHDPDQLHPSCLLSMRIWSKAKMRAADIADSERVRADAPWKGFRMLTFSIENY